MFLSILFLTYSHKATSTLSNIEKTEKYRKCRTIMFYNLDKNFYRENVMKVKLVNLSFSNIHKYKNKAGNTLRRFRTSNSLLTVSLLTVFLYKSGNFFKKKMPPTFCK